MAESYYHLGSPEIGIERIRSVLDELERGGPVALVAVLYVSLSRLHRTVGEFETSLADAERALKLVRSAVPGSITITGVIIARAEVRRGAALLLLGRLAEAIPVLEEAIPLAEKIDEPHTLAEGLTYLAAAHDAIGEGAKSRRCRARVREIEDQFGMAARQ